MRANSYPNSEKACHYNSTAATFDHFSEIAPPTSPDIMRGPSFTCLSHKHYVNSHIVYPCPTSPSFNSLYQSPLFPALLYPQSSFLTFFLQSQPSVGGITTSQSLRAIHLMRNVLIMCAQCRWPAEHFHCLHGNPPATSPHSPCWVHDCGLRDYASRRLVKGLPGSFCAVTDG